MRKSYKIKGYCLLNTTTMTNSRIKTIIIDINTSTLRDSVMARRIANQHNARVRYVRGHNFIYNI